MKKKIAILGSTGSIGKSLIDIIKKDKRNFEIILLSADENYKELLKQAKFFKVKNIIISNTKSFDKINFLFLNNYYYHAPCLHFKEIEEELIVSDPVVDYMSRAELEKSINSLKKKMEAEAKKENFMQAALMRDEMFKMKKLLLDKFD